MHKNEIVYDLQIVTCFVLSLVTTYYAMNVFSGSVIEADVAKKHYDASKKRNICSSLDNDECHKVLTRSINHRSINQSINQLISQSFN